MASLPVPPTSPRYHLRSHSRASQNPEVVTAATALIPPEAQLSPIPEESAASASPHLVGATSQTAQERHRSVSAPLARMLGPGVSGMYRSNQSPPPIVQPRPIFPRPPPIEIPSRARFEAQTREQLTPSTAPTLPDLQELKREASLRRSFGSPHYLREEVLPSMPPPRTEPPLPLFLDSPRQDTPAQPPVRLMPSQPPSRHTPSRSPSSEIRNRYQRSPPLEYADEGRVRQPSIVESSLPPLVNSPPQGGFPPHWPRGGIPPAQTRPSGIPQPASAQGYRSRPLPYPPINFELPFERSPLPFRRSQQYPSARDPRGPSPPPPPPPSPPQPPPVPPPTDPSRGASNRISSLRLTPLMDIPADRWDYARRPPYGSSPSRPSNSGAGSRASRRWEGEGGEGRRFEWEGEGHGFRPEGEGGGPPDPNDSPNRRNPPVPPPDPIREYIYYPFQSDEGPKLKEPDVFTGKDSTKLTAFVSQCTMWFYAKPRKFQREEDRVFFAASYLRDLASAWWMPILSQQPMPEIIRNWDMFTTELFQMFGNQHIQTTSQNELARLKMRNDARVTEYLVKFNSHAPYTGWNDVALAGQFYRGLPDRIKDKFQYVRKPDTFIGVRDFALEFDQRYWERQEELGHRPATEDKAAQREPRQDNRSQPNTQNPPQNRFTPRAANPQTPNTPAQTNPTAAAPAQPKPTSNKPASSTTTTKTQSSETTKSFNRGPLSPEEKDRRRREGLCLYCGKSGHGYMNCPNQSSRNAKGQAVLTFTTSENAADNSDQSENSEPTQSKVEDC
jgi:Retrotransposon gag protein